jgi:hypothetical protein
MNGTPRTARHKVHSSSVDLPNGGLLSPRSKAATEYPVDEREDAVEMSLLGNGQRAHAGDPEIDEEPKDKTLKPLSKKDKKAMALLIILCKSLLVSFSTPLVDIANRTCHPDLIQGVPVRQFVTFIRVKKYPLTYK